MFAAGLVAGGLAVTVTGVGGGNEQTVPVSIAVAAILEQNLFVLGVVLLGAVTLGLATVITLFYNGFLVGVVIGGAAIEGVLGVAVVAILPHGVFEYPAFVIGGAAALRLPRQLVRYLRGHRETPFDETSLVRSAALVGVAVVLLVIGAIIEVMVTAELVL